MQAIVGKIIANQNHPTVKRIITDIAQKMKFMTRNTRARERVAKIVKRIAKARTPHIRGVLIT